MTEKKEDHKEKEIKTHKEDKKPEKKQSLADKVGVDQKVVDFVKDFLKTDDEVILEHHIRGHYETKN